MLAQLLFLDGLIAAACSDLLWRRVPNALSIPLLAFALGMRLVSGGASSLREGSVGGAVCLALLLLPFSAGWLGGGDAKLAAAAGAWLGPQLGLQATLVGLALGGLWALALLLHAGPHLRAEVAANLRGAWHARGLPQVDRRPQAQTIPLAVPLAAGAALFLVGAGVLHG